VEEILRVVEERKGSKPGSVNWLEKLGDDAYRLLRDGEAQP